jgi:HEAT repeat protein
VTLLASLAASLLLAAAAPPTLAERLERVLALEDRRAPGDEMLRYLADPERSVRRRASLAAGRIGDAGATAGLVTLLNDSESQVRQMAAFALGLLGDAAAADRLVLALGDNDPVVRARAAEALGRLGDPARAPEIARMVREALPDGAPLVAVRGDDPGSASDPWLELRLSLFALERLKDVAAAESVLVDGSRSRFDWWAASFVAMRLASPRLKPVLLA